MECSLLGFGAVTAGAVVPEQLVPYVCAMGGGKPQRLGEGIVYRQDHQIILVAYPVEISPTVSYVDDLVTQALALPQGEKIIVLSPIKPSLAPQDAVVHEDQYWRLVLPLNMPHGRAGQKLRNVLKRAKQEITIEAHPNVKNLDDSGWTHEHSEIIESFIRTHPLGKGSATLFRQINTYLAQVEDAVLFSAKSAQGRIEGFCVADYSAMATAFYLFAFRRQDSPPGTADLLLSALIQEAMNRGHRQINLGLEINAGIAFFKKKWGAEPFLPFVETSWKRKKWWHLW